MAGNQIGGKIATLKDESWEIIFTKSLKWTSFCMSSEYVGPLARKDFSEATWRKKENEHTAPAFLHCASFKWECITCTLRKMARAYILRCDKTKWQKSYNKKCTKFCRR